MTLNFVFYVKNIPKFLKASKIPLNFQEKFKNIIAVSFRWTFSFKNTLELKDKKSTYVSFLSLDLKLNNFN